MLILIFLFPIVIIKTGINIKNCANNIHCESCGVTRDFYNIITIKKNYTLINGNSAFIFLVFLFNLLFRFCIVFKTKSILFNKKIRSFDILLSGLSLFLLFILFNIKF